MPKLVPLPGRILLSFQPPVEKSSLIHIPDTSKLRVEIGTVIAIGRPTNEKERIVAESLNEGDKIPVSYSAGVCYHDSNRAVTAEATKWMENFRVYSLSEVAAKVED